MRRRTLVLACLVAATAHGQTPPSDPADMARDPRLQQTVDVHLKRALVPELATFLKKHTDQHFGMELPFEPLMVCVFANKQPLWKIMNGVADVLGGRWIDLKSEWKLVLPTPTRKLLESYQADEQAVLKNDLYLRAKALADLVGNGQWAGGGDGAGGPQEMPDDITPEKWARSCIGQKPYFAAGIMFRDTSLLALPRAAHRPVQPCKRDCPIPFTDNNQPQAFTLAAPQNDAVRDSEMRVQTDQPGLDGTQIAVRSMPWAGTLEAVMVSGQQARRPKRLVARPLPTGVLAKTKAGKWLLDWNTDLDEAKDPLLDTQLQQISPEPSPYRSGLYGIEDYLEAVHKETGETIVSDAFRVPMQPDNQGPGGGTLKDWLKGLKLGQKCFVKVADGALMVRHGGFWDLRDDQPDEQVVRDFEAIKAPDLNDYANLAIRLNEKYYGFGQFPPYVQCEQPLLVKFDFTPLRNSFPSLLAFGQFDKGRRNHILAGDLFIGLVVNDNRVDTIVPVQGFVKDRDGHPIPKTGYFAGVDGSLSSSLADGYIGISGAFGIFYGATPTIWGKLMMETFAFPASYLDLTGRCPYDHINDVILWSACEGAYGGHGFQFSLASHAFNADDLNDPNKKVLYGSFRFLAGIAKDQGVYETIEIPEPVHG